MPQVNGNSGNPSGTSARPCGVWGDSRDYPGVIGTSLRRVAVRGETRDRTGVYGRSELASGVLGYGCRFGVQGIATGQEDEVLNDGLYAGVYGQAHDVGVYGEGVVHGVVGRTTAPRGGYAGVFHGNVYISGDLTVDGTTDELSLNARSSTAQHPDGTVRHVYPLESPESWFEDLGRAEMIEGHARVKLDGDFAAFVNTDDYHIFLTAEGESNGLYVSSRTPQEFEVREQGNGVSALPFSYRVVAKRKDVRAERMRVVEPRSVPVAPEVVPPDLEEAIEWEQE